MPGYDQQRDVWLYPGVPQRRARAEARVEQIKRRGASMGGPRVAPWSRPPPGIAATTGNRGQ